MAKRAERAWAYGELTTDDIVASAVQIIEREGLSKLTMRRLAQELGISSMLSYYYVPSKEALLNLVIDELYGRIEVPPPQAGDWVERMRQFFANARRELVRYPGLAELMQTRPTPTSGEAIAQEVHKILLEAGFDEQVAVDGIFAAWYFVLGMMAWEARAPIRAGKAKKAGSMSFGTRGNERAPEDRFTFGIDLLLHGLEASLKAKAPAKTRRSNGTNRTRKPSPRSSV